MESIARKLGIKLLDAEHEYSEEFEPELKLISAKSFACMSNCYKSDAPFQDCNLCSRKCSLTLAKAQTELEGTINHVNSSFKNCTKGCAYKFGEEEIPENVKCFEDCFNSSYAILAEHKDRVKAKLKEFL
ncbi:unnamed protein product [Blepharisma stoltei]|uniref:Uncharacterized protein n=1 Tax=Blepharisma stoltei TaxID=1481888 RepID=A0AAU9IRK8_9CILI|nr:unnamed protein product [Blepharisma stoltei]